MIVYQADANTNEYIGFFEAQKNPVDGGYLIPANCYTDEPGADKEGYTQVRKNNTWEYVVDYRNTTVYNTKDKSLYLINSFMEKIPDGYTDKHPIEFMDYCIWSVTEWKIDSLKKLDYDNTIADNKIKSEILELEEKSGRALRALALGTATDNDKKRLSDIDTLIAEKRNSLNVKG